jgi:surfeit locus 1 family protein
MSVKRFFSRQWLITSVLVIAAVLVMVRLGFWQLDRLAQRRAFNERVQVQLAADTIQLSPQNLDLDLYNMEYREAVISGQYDHERQVALRNQDWQGNLGVHLLTPLMIEGEDRAILVDRGWVPYEDFTIGNLAKFDVPGTVQIVQTYSQDQVSHPWKPGIGPIFPIFQDRSHMNCCPCTWSACRRKLATSCHIAVNMN